MARIGPSRSVLRAITAVVALYAFMLQAFLGTMLPAAAMAHPGVICAPEAGLAEGEAPGTPHHADHAQCCIAPSWAVQAEAPASAASALAWPSRPVLQFAWGVEAAHPARSPPRSIAHPRGPPAI
ncbi:hypothetical protein [Methylobacterium iners]|uniref:hypothetical protein n=1 Tax=Methylobacterium iners TaxID=418707 RepID=UPI001EE1C6B6|nr:hypothetical protein [Methylobacterium iners]